MPALNRYTRERAHRFNVQPKSPHLAELFFARFGELAGYMGGTWGYAELIAREGDTETKIHRVFCALRGPGGSKESPGRPGLQKTPTLLNLTKSY
jgi:hypothetical protein